MRRQLTETGQVMTDEVDHAALRWPTRRLTEPLGELRSGDAEREAVDALA